MQIPPFTLPSNPSVTVHLREASVADCEQFADADDAHAEQVTTLVLQTLQSAPDKYSDPAGWTADDRVLAAFWYHAHTTNDTSLHLPYDCPHCGQHHDALVNLTTIAASYRPIKGQPFRLIEHAGVNYRVEPLDGHAMEELEGLRQQAGEPGTSAYNRMQAVITRHELVATLTPVEFNGLRDDRIATVERAIRAMSLSDYRELRDKRDAALADMTHGLPSEMEDGRLMLLAPPVPCDEEKEAGLVTRLRFPFFSNDYLPRLR